MHSPRASSRESPTTNCSSPTTGIETPPFGTVSRQTEPLSALLGRSPTIDDLTQREISQRIGCSQMHVSRLLRRSMGHLEAAAIAA